MISYMRKKLFRDDRILQLMLLLSLLRGSPDDIFNMGDTTLDEFQLHDIALGSSLGHAQLSRITDVAFHPKSMDRMLANYQRNIIDDLNSLGRFSSANDHQFRDITAYLLNSQQNSGSTSTAAGPSNPPTPSSSSSVSNSINGDGNTSRMLPPSPPEPPPHDAILTPPSPRSPEYSPGASVVQDPSFEDQLVIDSLFKQDVDIGITREVYYGEEGASYDLVEPLNKDLVLHYDQNKKASNDKDKDFDKEPSPEIGAEGKEDGGGWAIFNITIDDETGEHIATEVTRDKDKKDTNQTTQSPTPLLTPLPIADTKEEEPEPESEPEPVAVPVPEPSPALLCLEPSVSSLSLPSPPYSPIVTDYELDFNQDFNFNLDEALKLDGLCCNDTGFDEPWKESEESASATEPDLAALGSAHAFEDTNSDSGISSVSLDAVASVNLDDMIQASQFHHPHPRPPYQGRLGGLVRSGSMEQRWQDLASLLSLPSTDPSGHHPHLTHQQSPPIGANTTSPPHTPIHGAPVHHPHALYPAHEGAIATSGSAGVPRGVLLHNATLPPPMPDPMAHNLTYSNSMGASSHLVSSSMHLTNSSDLAGPDHSQYKMETSSLPSDMMYYQNSTAEMNQTADGFLSTLLNDEDLQIMDLAMPEYNNRHNATDYGASSYRYPNEDPHRHTQVAQKKQYMFGRRGYHDHPQHAGSSVPGSLGSPVGGVPLVNNYSVHYPPTPTPTPAGANAMEGATALDPCDMKYAMEFRSQVSAGPVDHIQHNHTYHMSPEASTDMTRPMHRDKQRGRRSEHERSLTRDEKRARSLNLPISCDDIINLPMDEFNERISKYDLSENQLSLIRDIRRRGKNKVAAQNCRKRKLDQIMNLAEEVKVIHTRKSDLLNEYEILNAQRAKIKHKFALLYRHIFQSLRDPEGNPYSPHDYSLQQSADGGVLLVPRSSLPHPNDPSTSKRRDGKDDMDRRRPPSPF